MTSEESLLVEGGTLHSQSPNFDDSSLPGYDCMNNNTYPMMIKLIEGALDGMDPSLHGSRTRIQVQYDTASYKLK